MSIFSKVKLKRPKRSTFNLSHNTKTTFPIGALVPVYWTYAEPGTSFKASSIVQCRTMPMLAPIMHEVNIYTYWFECPVRLCMDQTDFENFMTGGPDGTAVVNYPKYKNIKLEDLNNGPVLLDYMGVPVQQNTVVDSNDSGFTFDAVPFRTYANIHNNFFRDPNVMAEVDLSDKFTGDRDELTNADQDILSLKYRCWTKDYLTSALPWAQRGGNVDVPFTVVSDLAMEGSDPTKIWNVGADEAGTTQYRRLAEYDQGTNAYTGTDEEGNTEQIDVTGHTKVISNVIGTINDFRMANALQRWKERNAVGGPRYIEQINAHYGVWADDYRLQRPKYLGGSRIPLQISEILQTSESTETSVQGTMSGRGYTMDNNGYVKTFTKEHSIIMCLMCVVPKASYFQGMPRKLDIRDKFDFPWPILGHLGEQEVRKGEVYYQGTPEDDEPFGYQSRYAQWKYEPNTTHGDFNDSLLFWTLSRKFANMPTLSRDFMLCQENKDGLNRIFPVMSNEDIYKNVYHHFWAQINFNIRAKRPLPYFGTPNL